LGDGSVKAVTERGNYYPACTDRDGQVHNSSIIFGDVGVMENGYSLFSITKLKEAGWRLEDKGEDGFSLTYGKYELKFDTKVRTTKGCLWAMYAPPRDGWKESTLVSATSATARNEEDGEKEKMPKDGLTDVGSDTIEKVNGSYNPDVTSEEEQVTTQSDDAGEEQHIVMQPSFPIEELVSLKGEEEINVKKNDITSGDKFCGPVFTKPDGIDGYELLPAVKRFWLHIFVMIRFLEFVKSMELWNE
jgi:hypothetical protein